MINQLSPHSMRMGQPALRWQDASPVGNGVIGALVFGHPREELIQTNHGRLFEEPDRTPAPEMTHILPEVRSLLLAGQREEAYRLWSEEWKHQIPKPTRMGCYLPGPVLRPFISTCGLCTKYMHTLDFSTGVDTVSFNDGADSVCRRVFASRRDDALIIEIRLSRPSQIIFSAQSGCEADGKLVFENRTGGAIFSMSTPLYSLSGALRLLKAQGDVEWRNGTCAVKNATYALFAYALEPADGRGDASYEHLGTLSDDFDTLLERHTALHRPLMEQVDLSINGITALPDTNEHLLESLDEDEKLNAALLRLFHYGRYLLISSCRPGAMPPNLQGIWNGDRHPMWASDYHNDVNIQMNYWQAPVGGLTEMMLALFDYYDSLIPDFRDNAQRVMGCRGILMGVSQTLSGLGACHDPLWMTWTGGAAWIAQHYYDYWRYTEDDDFLRERALPFLREAALFYEDFADFSGEKAIFAPSMSPENNPSDGQNTSMAVNATMDIALMRELFTNLIAGCRHLNMWTEDADRWEKLLLKLPEYETDPESGALREWLYPGLDENHNHRHESHLYGVFPGEEIGPDHEMFEAVRISLEKRMVVGLNQQTGWSLGNMACVRARLGNGDEAFDALEILVRSCVGSNLFTYHNDWRSQGDTMFWGHPHLKNGSAWGGNHPPFQIDANMCIPAAIMNMLLQLHGNTVSILPALPSAWKSGKVKGLCLPGGVKVDIEWADCKASVTLHGKNAARYTLTSPMDIDIIR